jgi:phenylalanyl-tRNA synthetase beta chain
MKLSLNWLKDYIELDDISAEEISKQLTMKSAEVEAAHWTGAHFEKVIIAKVENVVPHPDSDRLKLATVFDGSGRQTVVCGAPNVATGQTVAFAPLGTVLPGNFEIKPAKIRGVESCGMICAEDELGLGTNHDGIMVLDGSLTAGTPVSTIFGEKDYIIEIENKTINHRPDLWGHFGIARELKAIFKRPWKKELKYTVIKSDRVEEKFEIEINTARCLHYLGLKMGGLKVAPSPEWMKKRLENIGVRPINNIVYIANFVMYETGHPMHTFDRRDIAGNKIVIRDAGEGEKFVTLDGLERTLKAEDAVIADTARGLAIAGVMGGLNSEVKDDTTEIFIESALFHPSSVRKTSTRLDLRTDSSSRFEKALWVENCYLAMQRFVELTKELIPGAAVLSDLAVADNSANYGFKGHITLTTAKIRSFLGITEEKLPDSEIVSMLSFLDFKLETKGGTLVVEIPEHRRSKDVSRAEDIIEEIGRLYGYNNIEPVSPLFNMDRAPVNIDLEKGNAVRNIFVNCFGASEVVNYSFSGPAELEKVPFNKEKLIETVAEKEAPFLRYSLAPAMLSNVFENLKNFKDLSLFEFSRIFTADGEKKRMGFIATGEKATFDLLKSIVLSISKELRTPQLRFDRIKDGFMLGDVILHPGRSAVVAFAKTELGIMGEVHPALLKKYDISVPVYYIELDREALFSLPERSVKFTPLLKFPSTGFDVTVIVPQKLEIEELFKIIKKSVDPKIFVESKLVSHFAGAPIPEGFQSISFRIILNAKERTLTGDEMKNTQQKLFNDFRKAGYKISGD